MSEQHRFRVSKLISWSVLVLFLCFLTNISWAQDSDDAVYKAENAYSEWLEEFYTFLETSKDSQSRTLAGIHLYESGEPKSMDRGAAIIEAVLNAPSTEPVSLWTLAGYCGLLGEPRPWCESDGIYEKLIAADPGNAAALMQSLKRFHVPGDELSLDTKANRELLLSAANLQRFDAYWGRGIVSFYNEALAYFKTRPVPPVLESSLFVPQLGGSVEGAAFTSVMSIIVASPSMSYSLIIELCKTQVKSQRADTIKACNKLASMMQAHALTALTKSIGYALERVMLEIKDADNPRIHFLSQRSQLLAKIAMCQYPHWQTSNDPMIEISEKYLVDWMTNLDQLGEWEGNKLTFTQEYIAYPDHFDVNPADCEKLFDLSEEDTTNLLSGQVSYLELLSDN